MGIPTLIHGALVGDLVLLGQVKPCILLWGRPSSCDEDLTWGKSDGCGALVEFTGTAVVQFLDGPLVFVDVVAEADLGVYIITEQVDVSLVGIPIHGWELEEGLFDRAIVIHMDTVLEHEVAEVLVGLHKVIEHLQIFEISPLAVVEDVEVVLVRVEFHVLALVQKLCLLICNCLVSLLQLLFLLLQTPDLLVNLFLHHGVEVLLLDLQLFHDSSEGLLEPIDFIVELLSHLKFQFTVKLLASWCLLLIGLHLCYHFLDHPLHINN